MISTIKTIDLVNQDLYNVLMPTEFICKSHILVYDF